MRVVIFGGSGFIGKHLIPKLISSGHKVTLVSRHPESVETNVQQGVKIQGWNPQENLIAALEGIDTIVNLAGESIGAGRWTASRKEEILSSRIDTTKTIVTVLKNLSKKPSVLLNSSAVGYYGNTHDDDVIENHPAGKDFLADVCVQWENEARKAEQFGIRVVLPRTGIILAGDGGALQRMVLPFRLFVGGPLGSGRQWFPWIHIDDEIAAMIHAIENSSLSGPVNFAAPQPITMTQFCSALGKAMHRPSWAPVPSFVLKIILGEMAEALVLGGQKVDTKKLVESGFRFSYDKIENALGKIFS